jgi:hypothetical protein
LLTRFIFSVVSLIQETAVMKTNILSRDYPLQTKDHGFIGLNPIDSDDGDDDDDDDGGGGCGDYSSSGDREGNTLTTQMVAIEEVRDGAAEHSMSSQAHTSSGMYVHVLLLIDILTLNEVLI